MIGRFVLSSNEDPAEGNIFADKSVLILDWLLKEGIKRSKGFSLREIAKKLDVSIGLVQRVLGVLVMKGIIVTKGLRTSKKFFFKNPKLLIENWIDNYNISKKCKMRTYVSAFSNKQKLLEALKKSKLSQKVVLALHSSAEALGYKNTNLDTLEMYVLDPSIRPKLEAALQLEPKEKGYQVLLIEPYYESLLEQGQILNGIKTSPLLLTFLDLYHFPLRGHEQAEYIAAHALELKEIYGTSRR